MDYLVRWEIQIEAETAKEAASIAREVQLDPSNEATFYSVRRDGWGDQEWMVIELP